MASAARKVLTSDSCWIPKGVLGIAESLPSSSKAAVDASIFPQYLSLLASAHFDSFGSKLKKAFADIGAVWESDVFTSTDACINADDGRGAIVIRYSKGKCIKGAQRMAVKIEEARKVENEDSWPFAATIGDALRCSVICATCQGVRKATENIMANFSVVRLKNKFRMALEEMRGGFLETTSPNVHINVLLREDGLPPMVVEVQIYVGKIMDVKKHSHKLYQILRANSIQEVRTQILAKKLFDAKTKSL